MVIGDGPLDEKAGRHAQSLFAKHSANHREAKAAAAAKRHGTAADRLGFKGWANFQASSEPVAQTTCAQ